MDPLKATLDPSSTSGDDNNQAPAVGLPAGTTTVLPSPPQSAPHEVAPSSTAPPPSLPLPLSPRSSPLHEFWYSSTAVSGVQPPSPSFPPSPDQSSMLYDDSWSSSTVVALAPWPLPTPRPRNVVSHSDPGLTQSQIPEFWSSLTDVPEEQPPSSLPSLPSSLPLSPPPPVNVVSPSVPAATRPTNVVSHSDPELPQSQQWKFGSSSTTSVPPVQTPTLHSPLSSQLLRTGAAPSHLPPLNLNPHPHPMQPQMAADHPNPANPGNQPLPLALTPPPPPPLWNWAIDGRATVHPLAYLAAHNITTVTGEMNCGLCNENFHHVLNVAEKWNETMLDYSENGRLVELNGHTFRQWPSASIQCPKCGRTALDARPAIEGMKDGINWTFLFLARQLHYCSVAQLRYYLRETKTARGRGNNKRWLLYLVYTSLAKQLNPDFQPPQ